MKQATDFHSQRLRVMHLGKFYPPYKGGMETHLQGVCRALSPHADISALVSNTTRRSTHNVDGAIQVERIGTWANISSAPICPAMVSAIRRTPADIIHLHCPNPTAVLAYLVSGHPADVVITYHSDVVRQRALSYLYQPLFNRIAERARAIICFSPNYVASSPALKPFREKCRIIPHGIDPVRFQRVDPETVTRIRSRYGDRIVLAVGRLVYYKGFEFLIRALPADATLLIVGTGPLREKLSQVARESGSAARVHLLGEVEDVIPYYHAARVFVLPSVARSEAFGIAQLEAMACGTPVINTSLDSGVPFVSLNNESGYTVPPCNVDALTRAITTILDDRELHARFSEGGRRRVRERFTLDAMAQQTLQLYEEILGDLPAALNVSELVTA